MTKQQIKKTIEKATAAQMELERIYKAYYAGMITLEECDMSIASIIAKHKGNPLIIV